MEDILHVVAQGEWLTQIAKQYGFADYKPIYEYDRNADLRKKRPNPNELAPGDEVWIPGATLDVVLPTSTIQDKVWKVAVDLGAQEDMQLIIRDPQGKPMKNTEYTLKLGAWEKKGKTDGNGALKEKLYTEMLDAAQLTLTVAGQPFPLKVGHMDPFNTLTGAQGRLLNLGYDVGTIDGVLGPRTMKALYSFQAGHGLDADGMPNEATLKKLDEVYGGS